MNASIPARNGVGEARLEAPDTMKSFKTYAQIITGGSAGTESGKGLDYCEQASQRVSLKPEGNGWLYHSAVAKLHRFISINELKVQMAGMGLDNIDVKAMEGRSMILTCLSREEINGENGQ